MDRDRRRNILFALLLLAGLVVAWLASRWNYLLFHALAELFSIIIAACVFVFSWVSSRKTENHAFSFLGIVYLSIGILDLFHTLSYTGMPIFPSDIFYANQLWICARFMESSSLLIFVLVVGRPQILNMTAVLWIYLGLVAACLLAVFVFKVFPLCFIAGKGQTPFKIISEYVICAILAGAIVVLVRRRNLFDKEIFRFMVASLGVTIASEICFTLYTDNFGVMNVLGHLFKLISFAFVYRSMIMVSVEKPLALVFRELSSKLQEITRLNQELELANQTKNRFFSIIAHDLRGPMSSLAGMLAFINDGWERMDETDKRECISQLHDSSQRISRLLNNLLMWARNQMDNLEANPRELDPGVLVHSTIRLLEPAAQLKSIHLDAEIKTSARITGDQDMIDAILRNLVGNAVKFTPRGGRVLIRVREEDRQVLFEVIDTGVGLSPAELDELFRPEIGFHKPGTEHEAGTGLGLILCRDLAQRNHGEIFAQSEPGKGSIFSFSILRRG